MTESLFEFLNKQDVEYSEMFDMSKFSSIGIGGFAIAAIIPDTEEKLIKSIDFLKSNEFNFKIAGRMTNILPCDGFYKGVVIKTDKINRYFKAENKVVAGCGAVLSKLIKECALIGLGGAESLYGIPGSVGGAIAGNAGAFKSEISDFTEGVTVYSPSVREIFYLSASELEFSYRSSIFKRTDFVILSVILNFKKGNSLDIQKQLDEVISARKMSQPYSEKSLGSIFKRFEGASVSKLIDQLGMKGTSVGGAEISKKHAGFIINRANAKASDVIELIKIIKNKLYASYGITPEEEIEIWE